MEEHTGLPTYHHGTLFANLSPIIVKNATTPQLLSSTAVSSLIPSPDKLIRKQNYNHFNGLTKIVFHLIIIVTCSWET